MGMYDSNDWMASLHREVGGGVRIGPHIAGYAVTLLLPCSVCHQNKEFPTKEKLPPPVYAKKLRTKGWHIGKHLVCPSCVKTRPNAVRTPQPIPQPAPVTKVQDLSSLDQLFATPKEEKRAPTKAELLGSLSGLFNSPAVKPPVQPTEVAKTSSLPVPAAKPAAAKAARAVPAPQQQPLSEEPAASSAVPAPTAGLTKVQRSAVMLALEAHFHPDTGSWSGGYSDAKVARETEVAVNEVVALRREWFGELQESAELQAARQEYELHRQEMLDFVAGARADLAGRKENVRRLLAKVRSLEN